jgi:hypothetical protein
MNLVPTLADSPQVAEALAIPSAPTVVLVENVAPTFHWIECFHVEVSTSVRDS